MTNAARPTDDLQQATAAICKPLDFKLMAFGLFMAVLCIPIFSTSIQIYWTNLLTRIPGVSVSKPAVENEQKETPVAQPTSASNPQKANATPASAAPAPSGTDQQEFERVMEFILKWEGKCSDDPADNGGRTYMGITWETAKRNGWTGDVCNLPRSKVLEIYKKDYWNVHAHKYKWPVNLAVMNVSNNAGTGAASEHLAEMPKSITNLNDQALWLANRMALRYRRIVAKNPTQKRFERGWHNRNNDLIQTIKTGKVKK